MPRKNPFEVGGSFPLAGYAPDVDPRQPGVITNCTSIVPSLKGMKGAPSAQSVDLDALAAACQGAAVLRKLDNTSRFIAGTATKLYEAGSGTWTDRTRASGGDYALGADLRWTFAQFADTTLAAAESEILQTSSSGAFANAAADAPKASIVETANGFVFLFDVNDQGGIYDSTERPHGWWAARTVTTWTPSVANEAYTGELTSSPGKITAGRRFGDKIIAYKQRSMFLGIYAGQSGWEFSEIPGQVGAVSQEAVIVVGTADDPRHIFMGLDDFYSFDGARPVPVGSPLRETVFSEMDKSLSHLCTALHDSINSRIYFFYPSVNASGPDKCVVYNYRSGRWGRDDRPIEAVAEYVTGGLSFDDFGSSYTTFHDVPNIAFDSPFWTSGFPVPAIFNSSHQVQTLDGTATTSSMTLGDMGSDQYVSCVRRVMPAFLTRPSSATLTNSYKMSLGDSYTADVARSMGDRGQFDFMRSAHWHRLTFDFIGAVELPSLHVDALMDGER